MRSIEKAVQTAATVKDGVQLQIEEYPSAPHIKDYTPIPGSIASLLLHGEKNALTTRELSSMTGMHPRDVTDRIRRERASGAPIMSSGCGYWLAEDAAEVRRCAAALHARAGEIHRTAKALEKIGGG